MKMMMTVMGRRRRRKRRRKRRKMAGGIGRESWWWRKMRDWEAAARPALLRLSLIYSVHLWALQSFCGGSASCSRNPSRHPFLTVE